jgi:Glycosyltransferase family 87
MEEADSGVGWEPGEVSFACAVWFCMIVAYAALQLSAPFGTGAAFRTRYFGADFAEFYIAGKILNQHGADALYDLDLQTRLFRALDPRNQDSSLWFVCAPYLAQAFRPFALLSYRTAYIAWMIVSMPMYVLGIAALSPFLANLPKPYRRAALLLGLTFVPVALWSLVGGQIGVIAFAIIAWCVRFDLSGKQLAAGAALALCSYKPTFLLLFCPFLLLRMNLRFLLGFAAGLSGLLVVSSLASIKAVFDWFRLISTYRRFAAQGSTPWPEEWPLLIDLNHFVKRIFTTDAWLSVFITAAVFIGLVALLARYWRRFDSATLEERQLIWAVTITSSLLANLYVTAYDSATIVVGALLTASALWRHYPEAMWTGRFYAMVAVVYLTALIPAPFIAYLRVHFYTLAITVLAVFQYKLLRLLSKTSANPLSPARNAGPTGSRHRPPSAPPAIGAGTCSVD